MPREIRLPELAESVVEGEIQRWLVAEGEVVAKDQPIVEVMTDKATIELPSPAAGIIQTILAKPGDVVAVHSTIALLNVEGDDTNPDPSLFKASEAPDTIRNPFLTDRTPATPAARQMAEHLGVDIRTVAGTGPRGRVRPEDVAGAAAAKRPGGTVPPPVPYRTPAGYERLETRTPLRGVRRAIAQQMTASHIHTARTLVVDEADFTALIATRQRLQAGAADAGTKLTYLPFVFRAVASALGNHPPLNSSIDEAAQEIVLKRYCNLGMAVAAEAGLVVPVIRDIREKSLFALAAETRDLAERARQGRLAPEELHGSTFTVTSIGPIGTLFSFPIINVPDAAILGLHTVTRRPVVVTEDGAERVAIRDMVYLSLSFDHRLVDGFAAATFLREVVGLLEAPEVLVNQGPAS